MVIGHGNPDVSIAYYGERNRPRKNGNTYGKIRCGRAWFRIGPIGPIESDSNCRASIPACRRYPNSASGSACPTGERMGGRKRMVPCAANSRYYPPICTRHLLRNPSRLKGPRLAKTRLIETRLQPLYFLLSLSARSGLFVAVILAK